jgi:hypothetical protein
MGTSQSSNGASSGVPLVPPWVPPLDLPDNITGEDESVNQDDQQDQGSTPSKQMIPPQLAPIARFGSARRNIGEYAHGGSSKHMRQGLGHYIHKGLGGSSTAVRRFGGTIRAAGDLNRTFLAFSEGKLFKGLDPKILSSRSAREVLDAIVETVRPVDGNLDAEASRDAISKSLSELLSRFPDADILNLTEEQRLFAIQQYIALDVFNRFQLDLGKTIQEKAPSALVAMQRIHDIRNFVIEQIAASFRKIQNNREYFSSHGIEQIVQSALKDTFEVFEEYVK